MIPNESNDSLSPLWGRFGCEANVGRDGLLIKSLMTGVTRQGSARGGREHRAAELRIQPGTKDPGDWFLFSIGGRGRLTLLMQSAIASDADASVHEDSTLINET
jgi:hypothetical protein